MEKNFQKQKVFFILFYILCKYFSKIAIIKKIFKVLRRTPKGYALSNWLSKYIALLIGEW